MTTALEPPGRAAVLWWNSSLARPEVDLAQLCKCWPAMWTCRFTALQLDGLGADTFIAIPEGSS